MLAQLDPVYIKTRPAKAVSRFLSELVFEGRPIPRRWRWTNYINIIFLKLISHIPEVKPVKSPIYIIGTGRSGTTVLSKILSTHRDVGFLNEPKLIWHVAYPKEDVIGSYSRGRAYYRLGSEQVTEDVRRVIPRIYAFYLAATGSHRILDKYPEMIFRVSFILSIFPAAKFILIVRNGMDSIQSVAWWCKKYSRAAKNGEFYDWWGVNGRKWRLLLEQVVAFDPAFNDSYQEIEHFSRPFDMAAVEWIASMREGIRLKKDLSKNIHIVHYEELVNRPIETCRRILEYCELQPDEAPITYASKVLYPAPSKPSIDLDTCIQPLFDETMRLLGYKKSE